LQFLWIVDRDRRMWRSWSGSWRLRSRATGCGCCRAFARPWTGSPTSRRSKG